MGIRVILVLVDIGGTRASPDHAEPFERMVAGAMVTAYAKVQHKGAVAWQVTLITQTNAAPWLERLGSV